MVSFPPRTDSEEDLSVSTDDAGQGKINAECCAYIGFAVYGYVSVMLFYDAVDCGESEPCPFPYFLCREEGIKDMFL